MSDVLKVMPDIYCFVNDRKGTQPQKPGSSSISRQFLRCCSYASFKWCILHQQSGLKQKKCLLCFLWEMLQLLLNYKLLTSRLFSGVLFGILCTIVICSFLINTETILLLLRQEPEVARYSHISLANWYFVIYLQNTFLEIFLLFFPSLGYLQLNIMGHRMQFQ